MKTLHRLAAAMTLAGTVALGAGGTFAADNEIIIFKDGNGQGKTVTVTEAVSDLGAVGMNDAISSVLVLKGKWELCKHAAFQGTCIVVGPGLSGVGDLNDQITSIRPYVEASTEPPEGEGAALLFFDADGGGTAIRVTGDIKNFDSISANDKISSVAVFAGTWQICKDANYKGSCTILEEGAAYNLESYNNKVSSMRLVTQ